MVDVLKHLWCTAACGRGLVPPPAGATLSCVSGVYFCGRVFCLSRPGRHPAKIAGVQPTLCEGWQRCGEVGEGLRAYPAGGRRDTRLLVSVRPA